MLPVIGLPRGKLQRATYEFLQNFGIDLPSYNPDSGSRNYQINTEHAIFLVDNPMDLVKRVSLEDLNAAIAGGDSVVEFEAEYQKARENGVDFIPFPPDYLQSTELPRYLSWRVVVLGRRGSQDPNFESLLNRLVYRDSRPRVHSWTEYPYTEQRLIHQIFPDLDVGIYPHSDGEVIIFPSSGTTESKLRRGDSMFGLEVVSTGESAEANELREFKETSRLHGPVIIKPHEYSDPFVDDLISRLTEFRLLTRHSF